MASDANDDRGFDEKLDTSMLATVAENDLEVWIQTVDGSCIRTLRSSPNDPVTVYSGKVR